MDSRHITAHSMVDAVADGTPGECQFRQFS